MKKSADTPQPHGTKPKTVSSPETPSSLPADQAQFEGWGIVEVSTGRSCKWICQPEERCRSRAK